MKKKIHPKYDKCTIKCACGSVIETRSTTPEINVEIMNIFVLIGEETRSNEVK